MKNGLDSVLLSPRAVSRWIDAARDAVRAHNVPPAQIQDEDCEVLPSGDLRIFCQTAYGEMLAAIVVPADEWAWRKEGVN